MSAKFTVAELARMMGKPPKEVLFLLQGIGVDVKSAEKLAKKIQAGDRFDLNDFKEQVGQMRRMGGISGLLDKLPVPSKPRQYEFARLNLTYTLLSKRVLTQLVRDGHVSGPGATPTGP